MKYQLKERTFQANENNQGTLILKNFRTFSYVKPFALAAMSASFCVNSAHKCREKFSPPLHF